MIQSITNPPMTRSEINKFRQEFIRYASGQTTKDERERIREKYVQICSTAEKIIKNNGGKNPILGY